MRIITSHWNYFNSLHDKFHDNNVDDIRSIQRDLLLIITSQLHGTVSSRVFSRISQLSSSQFSYDRNWSRIPFGQVRKSNWFDNWFQHFTFFLHHDPIVVLSNLHSLFRTHEMKRMSPVSLQIILLTHYIIIQIEWRENPSYYICRKTILLLKVLGL